MSLSYSAATREVTRWADGAGTVVGDDVFTALEHELRLGARASGSATSGTPPGPTSRRPRTR